MKRDRVSSYKKVVSALSYSGSSSSAKKDQEEYLLVDGYNIIFAWPELKELADADVRAAQTKLMDILSNYQGYSKCKLILVFDAYKVPGGTEHVEKYHNIYIVYTKEAETADQYIEKTVHKIGRQSSGNGCYFRRTWNRLSFMGQGASRISVKRSEKKKSKRPESSSARNGISTASPVIPIFLIMQMLRLRSLMEEVRLGKKKL